MFATFGNVAALDICIYVYVHGLCFQYTFQPRRSTVEFKCIPSRCLVQFLYMCMVFFPFGVALCCLIKVKLVGKWSEKFIIWLFFLSVFRSYALWGSGSGWLAFLTHPRLFSVVKSVCVCLCAVLVRNQSLCHRSGLELVTCLGSPADVPYWETVPAGFPNCAFRDAWYLSQLESGLCCVLFEFRVILRKGQLKAQCLTWDKVPKCQILLFFTKIYSYIK